MPGPKAAEAQRRDQVLTAAYEVASEEGLRSLTIRNVALRAELSPGLVLFHFGSKEQLIQELLEWVLARTTALHVGPEIAAISSPPERLLALLRQEMLRLSSEPTRIRLFFDFWSVGIWNRPIRLRMQAELDRYREAFRPMVSSVLTATPERFPSISVDALAAVVVSFIKGCAVQSMIDPEFDTRGFLRAVETLLVPALGLDHPAGTVGVSVPTPAS